MFYDLKWNYLGAKNCFDFIVNLQENYCYLVLMALLKVAVVVGVDVEFVDADLNLI